MSDRIGANRAYLRIPFTQVKLVWIGLFHGMADGLKLLVKEIVVPTGANKFLFVLAPVMAMMPAMAAWAVIPFAPELVLADIDAGQHYAQITRPAGLVLTWQNVGADDTIDFNVE